MSAQSTVFAQNIDYFKSKSVNIPKITVMVDHGYYPDKLIPALQAIYPQIMSKIRFKVDPKTFNLLYKAYA